MQWSCHTRSQLGLRSALLQPRGLSPLGSSPRPPGSLLHLSTCDGPHGGCSRRRQGQAANSLRHTCGGPTSGEMAWRQ